MLSFLFSFLLPLAASDAVTGAIEQAQALAVKKQRQAATTSLKQALETLPAPIKSRGKIVESIHAISKIFFTDKGQKDFEVGQATLWENPDLALVSLRASLASEDGNILVQGHIARALLIKHECVDALATLASAREMTPFSSELAILELRALTCQ